MKIKFRHCRRKRIRKFLSGFHGKERTDLYKIFTAIAYLVYTGCQWKMMPRYLMGRKLPSPRILRSDPAVNIYCRIGSKKPVRKRGVELRECRCYLFNGQLTLVAFHQ